MKHRTSFPRRGWLIALLLCPLPLLAATQQRWRGDVNGDGKLSLADLTAMIAQLKSATLTPTDALKAKPALDVDKDGKFTTSDLQALTNILLGKAKPELLPTDVQGHGFSDGDMGNPGTGDSAGGFSDSGQSNPGTGDSAGGFKDEDMGNPE